MEHSFAEPATPLAVPPRGGLAASLLAWLLLLLCAPHALAADRLTIHERALNIDKDPGFEALEVRCEARFAVPGNYSVLFSIADPVDYYGLGSATWASGTQRSPFPDHRSPPAEISGWSRVTTDSLGRARVTVYFYCDELSRMQADGPWRFTLYARLRTDLRQTVPEYSDAEAHRETLTVVTRPWRRSGFDFNYQGELAAPDYDPFEWRPGHELVFTQGYDLVVVTVLAGDSAGTQGHPPVVVTRVDEVLRGAPRSGGMRVIWAPRPLWIPCPVGEEEGIRRWGETPIASPAVGSRWILGGHAGPDSSSWFNVYDCRWDYSDALRQHFIDESAPWAVRIQRLHHKLDELIREAGRRDRAEARRTKARGDSVQTAAERAWLAGERTRSQRADIDDLVRSATRIVVGRIGPQRWSGHPIADFHVVRPLSPAPVDTTSSLPVFVGARESAIVSRWQSAPADLVPGPSPGAGALCIAFLCDRYWGLLDGNPPRPACRVADPRDGLLLADPRTLRRVETAIARAHRAGPVASMPQPSWRELAAETTASPFVVDLKLSPLGPPGRLGFSWPALVLSCGHEPVVSSVLSRALDPALYYAENVGYCGGLSIGARDIAVLLDSLAALPAVRSGRVKDSDILSLTLRRTLAGRETQFECTMDASEVKELTRVMAHVLHKWALDPSTGRNVPVDPTFDVSLWSWFHGAGHDLGVIWDATFPP